MLKLIIVSVMTMILSSASAIAADERLAATLFALEYAPRDSHVVYGSGSYSYATVRSTAQPSDRSCKYVLVNGYDQQVCHHSNGAWRSKVGTAINASIAQDPTGQSDRCSYYYVTVYAGSTTTPSGGRSRTRICQQSDGNYRVD